MHALNAVHCASIKEVADLLTGFHNTTSCYVQSREDGVWRV